MKLIRDEYILRLLKKDSQAGMELLIDEYGSLVVYIIRQRISSVCSEYDVEECAADTFTDLYESLDSIDLKKGSLKGYISLIARRRAIDRFNTAAKEKGMTAAEEPCFDSLPDTSPDPEAAAISAETGACLLEEVRKLGEPDNEILFRRYYLEQSVNEIAQALSMKRPAVSKRIARALNKLRVSMEGYI